MTNVNLPATPVTARPAAPSAALVDRPPAQLPIRSPAARWQELSGWGRSVSSGAVVAHPLNSTEMEGLVRLGGGRGVIARGMGRSYGDAALCRGGTVVDMTGRDRIVDFDPVAGLVIGQAGATLAQVMAVTVPQGWVLPVLPGTGQVTLGGAVAADIHGKNHVSAGSFGNHVQWLVVMGGDGRPELVSPDLHPQAFWATVGGMGLTGVIVAVAVRLRRVASDSVLTVQRRAADLEAVLRLLDRTAVDQADDPDLHAVAWIDAAVAGQALGRGIVATTRLLAGDEAQQVSRRRPGRAGRAQEARPAGPLVRAALPGPGVITARTIRAANWGRWVTAQDQRERVTGLAEALHPLDGAGSWPAAFGRQGLLQYQFVVPPHAEHVLLRALSVLRAKQLPPALAVLKRMGPANPAPLSFPIPGWTLALDFPARWAGLPAALARLDEMVADAGGRVYLAKDSRLGPSMMAAMYPGLPRWQVVRETMDPGRVFSSDLARRLELIRPGEPR